MDTALVGWWQIIGIDMIADRAVGLIGGLPGQRVKFTLDGRYYVGRSHSFSLYRVLPSTEPAQMDLWIPGLEPLIARCLYRIEDRRLTICVAGDYGERPTELRRDDVQLWCLVTFIRPEYPKRRRPHSGAL